MLKTLMRGFTVVTLCGLLFAMFVGGEHPVAGSIFLPPWDKLAHFGFFLSLYLLLREGLSGPMWFVALLALFVGMADELHQLGLPARHADWDDLLADVGGISFGVFVHGLTQRPWAI